jgi:cation:H+ antiporter
MTDALRLAFGILLLVAGGHGLVAGAVTIARRLGVSTLVVGLTIVAMGTSAPELAFNVIAALSGHEGLSFGNIVGSNIANIGLVLGITAIVTPLVVHGRVVSKELPWLVVVSIVALLVTYLPGVASVAGGGFSRISGFVMLLWFGVFMVTWYRMGRSDRTDPLVKGLGEEAEAEALGSMKGAIVRVLTGLFALGFGGKFAEEGAVGLAQAMGLSEALIGLTIVAIATSLPEAVTALVAVRKGHHDLAIGNIVGSNLFNLLLVLGVTAVIKPVPRPEHGVWDLAAMTVITILLWVMALTHKLKVTRPEGVVLLGLYLGYMTWSVLREI